MVRIFGVVHIVDTNRKVHQTTPHHTTIIPNNIKTNEEFNEVRGNQNNPKMKFINYFQLFSTCWINILTLKWQTEQDIKKKYTPIHAYACLCILYCMYNLTGSTVPWNPCKSILKFLELKTRRKNPWKKRHAAKYIIIWP